jgi:nitrogen fixation/metabolism regulation signal transduction histidine kinase
MPREELIDLHLDQYRSALNTVETPILLVEPEGAVSANMSAKHILGLDENFITLEALERRLPGFMDCATTARHGASTVLSGEQSYSLTCSDVSLLNGSVTRQLVTKIELQPRDIEMQTVETLTAHMDMPVVLIDEKGTVLFSNNVASGFLGSLIGSDLGTLLDRKKSAVSFEELLGQVQESGDSTKYHPFFCETEDGQKNWVLCSIVPLPMNKGKALCFFIDVTYQRQREHFVNTGKIARRVAHDVNNLLLSITLHTELLFASLESGESISPEELEQTKKCLLTSVNNAGHLMKTFLGMNGKENDEEHLENINAFDFVRKLSSNLAPLVDVQGIKSTYKYLGEEAALLANPERLRSALTNLVTNSIDAINERMEPPREGYNFIDMTVETTPEYISFFVSDSGVGMTEEQRLKMFEPFYTTKQKGHGIGLETVQATVHELGGTIQVASKVGRGTTITIVIPRADVKISQQITQEQLA